MSSSSIPSTRPDRPIALTSGLLLARNAAWNLISQGAPMAVAILTIPVLIRGLGTDRFGVLTLAWMVLGYFSLFDLGLGRALTKLVAEKLGLGQLEDVPALIWTALGLMMVLGLAGSAFVGLISPWMVRDALKIPGPLRAESLMAFYLMAASIPFVVSTAGLRGVMEAHQRFGFINVVRTGIGVFSLVGPLLVLPFSRSLVPVVAVIFAGRLASWAIHLVLCVRAVPGLRQGFVARLDLVRPLVGFGGWMTLTNIINPLMVQMDRFLVGALAGMAAVAYYTTPYELVTKSWFLSNSVLGVIFPAFATSYVHDRARTTLIFGKGVKYIFLILFPITLGLIALAPEILALWLRGDFAVRSAPVLRWLAVGVFLNGLAQVPSALTQGVGRPDLTFKLHLVELPLYLVAVCALTRAWGIEGAAMAWTARTALDLVLFFGAAWRLLPGGAAVVRWLAGGLGLALPLVAICALPSSLTVRAPLLATILAAAAVVTWRRVLGPEEKAPILSRFAPRRGATVPVRAGAGGRSGVEVAAV